MGYAQQDPLVAYKKESFDRYRDLLHTIQTTVIRELCLAHTSFEQKVDT
jgi:preprotein translocase subunit SecA